jgi:hypothetical protein
MQPRCSNAEPLQAVQSTATNRRDKENRMPALFNNTIIACHDRNASAKFYQELIEASGAPSWVPFTNILLDGAVMLQFAEPPVEIQMQHYAFLVDDEPPGRLNPVYRPVGQDFSELGEPVRAG